MIGPTPDPVPVAAATGAFHPHRFSRAAFAVSLGLHVALIAAAALLEVQSDPPEPFEEQVAVEVEVIVEIPAKKVGIPRLDAVGAETAGEPPRSPVAALSPVAATEAAPLPPSVAVAARPIAATSARPIPQSIQPRPPEPETGAAASIGTLAALSPAVPPVPQASSRPPPPAAAQREPPPPPAPAKVTPAAPAMPEPPASPAPPAIAGPAVAAAPQAATAPPPEAAAVSPAVAPAQAQDAPPVLARRAPAPAGNAVQEIERPEPQDVAQSASPKASELAITAIAPVPTPDPAEAESPAPAEVVELAAAPVSAAMSQLRIEAPEPPRIAPLPAEAQASATEPEAAPQARPPAPAPPQALEPHSADLDLARTAAPVRAEPNQAVVPPDRPSAPATVNRDRAEAIAPGVPVAPTALAQAEAPPDSAERGVAPAQVAAPPPRQPISGAPLLATAAVPAGLSSALQPLDPSTQIESLMQSYDCARISSRYELMAGDVEVAGHVRSEADRRDLLAKLAEVPGVSRVEGADLHIVQEPHCRVLTLLARTDLMRSEQLSKTADPGRPMEAGVRRLAGGKPLELQLKGPDFDGHVYVDHFTADGQVHHLLPRVSIDDNFVAAGEQFSIGRIGVRSATGTIRTSFDLDMVVAIGTSAPLFRTLRPATEDAADYLAALEAAIAAARTENPELRIEYVYHLIYTAGPPPS